MPGSGLDQRRLHALLGVGRSLVSELDREALFRRVLDVARELTGARYAALGVLADDREELERFITSGIDEQTHREIGDLPRGRGHPGRADPQSRAAAARGHRRPSPLATASLPATRR